MSLVPGMHPAVIGRKVVRSFLSSATSATDATAYTYSAMSFGAAFAGRVLVACLGARRNSAASISSVTIGGVTATNVITANNTGGGADIAAIYAAVVPTGTSGDVVVTYSGTMLRAACTLYSLRYVGGITAADTGSDTTLTGSTVSDTLNVPATSAVIACVGWSGTPYTNTWTAPAEDFDSGNIEGGWSFSSASAQVTSANASYDVSVTHGATPTNPAMACAVWRPT